MWIEAEAVIISSKRDPASMTIREALFKLYDFKHMNDEIYKVVDEDIALITLDLELLYSDVIEDAISANLAVFASKHRSKSGAPSLLVHTTGNWSDDNSYGGKPRELCIAPASHMKAAVLELIKAHEELGLEGWNVGIEVTHHGPFFKYIPVMFVELGSTEREWRDERAAEAIARAIYAAVTNRKTWRAAVGFGGPHYAPKFLKYVINSEWAVGHIAPSYQIDNINRREVLMAFKRTLEKTNDALLDWKGLKAHHKDKLIPILEDIGINFRKI